MRRESWLVAGGIWLAVVAAVALATWSVIDSAGRDVLAEPAGGVVPTTGATSVDPMTTGPSVEVRTGATSRPSPRPGEPGRSRGPQTRSPLVSPSPSLVAPSGGATTPSASSSREPGGSPAPATRSRTWQGTAGTVTTRCSGSRISLVSASPRDGWGMEIDERGPREVAVKFERGETDGEDGDGSERETEVTASCSAGTPRFEVDS